ncbi:hypothetical protein SAMN05892883_0726 [Jatrophihabitans sp. GAS493]|uniref:DUF6801 domain-containing protein n=1 Tax=Jatrophihabitans sp. GAS493 TaxID=1907575 RepID=UPI000BB6D609|nr:DUF6801 domain-containing protein [Jatrophihabitans sp. GAS493]SOD71147.1 hypothetical protein SAMN05892883_0726 [Jatrophihabitans sp. GAS493]
MDSFEKRKLIKSVSGVTVVGLVAGLATAAVAVVSGAAVASAVTTTTISKTLNTTCTIPVAGAQQYTAVVKATIPTSAKVGDKVALQNFSISVKLNVATTDALQILGATTLQGSIKSAATLSHATPSPLSITATVPTTAVPQTVDANGDGPAFSITATGTSPTATFTSAGTATLTATTVSAVFNPKNAAGTSVLPVAKQAIACSFNTGQSLVLATIPVAATTTAVSKTLNTTCTIPVAGAQKYAAKITGTLPITAKVGASVTLSSLKISILLNVATTDALQILGATTIAGSITAGTSLTHATPATLSTTATVPTTAVPQTVDVNGDGPPFTITATGTAPTAKLTSTGTAVLSATTVSAVFNPKNAAGTSVLPVAKQKIACTFDAGQSLVLGSITVTPATTVAVSKTLNATCTIPVAGVQHYVAKVTGILPISGKVGAAVTLSSLKISILLSVPTTDALQLLGATTIAGSVTAGVTLTHATPTALKATATVPTTAVPQTVDANGDGPAFSVVATGTAPYATLASAGSAVLSVTTVSAVFNPKNAAGTSVLSATQQKIPCSFDSGQSLVLGTITVT